MRQSEDRAVGAAPLTAAGNAAVERLSPEAYATLSAAVAVAEDSEDEDEGGGEGGEGGGGEGGGGEGGGGEGGGGGGEGGGEGGQGCVPACQRIVAMLRQLEQGGLCAQARHSNVVSSRRAIVMQ